MVIAGDQVSQLPINIGFFLTAMTNDKRIGGLRNSLVSGSEPIRLILRVSSRHVAMTNEILLLWRWRSAGHLKRFSLGYSGIANHGEHGDHGDVLFCSSPCPRG